MITKTKIGKRLVRKSNPEIAQAILLAKQNKAWFEVAKVLSGPTKRYSSINLDDLEKQSKAGDVVIVPGKVLGIGELSKKIKICSLGLSESAQEKIKASKSETSSILEEIKKNPKAEGVKLIR